MSSSYTLFINDLLFSGCHGPASHESSDNQSFQIHISLEIDGAEAAASDKLADTYDYKCAMEAARFVIESERHMLIERIVHRIAERILISPKVRRVEVKLEKIHGDRKGLPGILHCEKKRSQKIRRDLLALDAEEIVGALKSVGAISLPILTGEYRRMLLQEAETSRFDKQPEVVGLAKVHEDLSSTYAFRPGSLFSQLRDEFQRMLIGTSAFSTQLNLNEMSLQLYEKGSMGITPHMDQASRINLVCVFVLTGQARFALCDDRSGANPRDLDTSPGNVIIIRAPGFMGTTVRPMHFLSDVTERRIVFGLRQRASK
jgi:dihydroneopterin aldolase